MKMEEKIDFKQLQILQIVIVVGVVVSLALVVMIHYRLSNIEGELKTIRTLIERKF